MAYIHKLDGITSMSYVTVPFLRSAKKGTHTTSVTDAVVRVYPITQTI